MDKFYFINGIQLNQEQIKFLSNVQYKKKKLSLELIKVHLKLFSIMMAV